MSLIDSTSQATGVGVGANNVPFVFTGENQEAIVGIFATYDPAKTSVVDEVPVEVLSAGDVAERAGYGQMAHRLAIRVFDGLNGAGKVYWIPQAEAGGAAASAGEIAWAGGPTTKPGYIYLRINEKLYQVPIPSGSTIENISDAVVAQYNADPDAPLIAAKTAVTFETTFTAKSKGPWGDLFIISLNTEQGEAFPTGLTSGTITAMTGGSGVPTMADALNGLGTGDDANEVDITHIVHGYNLDTTTIDAISAYVGEGNTLNGLYDPLVDRPFVCLNGDVTAGSAGYTALAAIAAARQQDRTNGYLGVPDSASHPDEIAAYSIGKIASVFRSNPAQHYAGITLGWVDIGDSADRWTKNYSQRDIAVKAGISPTRIIKSKVVLQNVITSYRYGIPVASNGYKSFRTFAITRNIMKYLRDIFEADDWQGTYIVENAEDVTGFAAAQKVRDINSVKTVLNNLADYLYQEKGFLYNSEFTKENSTVAIRTLSNGFDINFKYIVSGELQVVNILQSFDTNIAAAA